MSARTPIPIRRLKRRDEMRLRHTYWAMVLIVTASGSAAAEEPKVDEYARVEVRATLGKFAPSPIRRPEVWWYSLTVGRGAGQQTYLLDLATEDLRKQAKDLYGQPVVASGDLGVEEDAAGRPKGDPIRRLVIRVKTLQKADPPKK